MSRVRTHSLRWTRVATLAALAGTPACARDNPTFGLGADTTSPTGASRGDGGPNESTGSPAPQSDSSADTGVNTRGESDATTFGGDTTPSDTFGDGPIDCSIEHRQSSADTFVVRSAPGCGNCALLNFGATLGFAVASEGKGEVAAAFLLARFGVANIDPATVTGLTVIVTPGMGAFAPTKLTAHTMPNEWAEGAGDATIGQPGESTWAHESVPNSWTDNTSNFGDVVGDAIGLTIAPDPGMRNPIEIPIDDPIVLLETMSPKGELSVAITATTPITLATKELAPDAIRLRFELCP